MGDGDSGQVRAATRNQRFKAVTAGLAVLLLVAIDLVAGSLTVPSERTSFRRWHPYYHHGLRPLQDTSTSWGPRTYRIVTDSLGFRDSTPREIDAGASTQTRVLLLGDSYLEGVGVEEPATAAGLLRQRWSQDGIEVLNGAVLSYSPKLHRLKTEYLIDEVGLHVDRLIVFVDVSDIQDELFYESFEPRLRDSAAAGLVRWLKRHSLTIRTLARATNPASRVDNAFTPPPQPSDKDWIERERMEAAPTDDKQDRWRWTVEPELFEAWGRRGLELAGAQMRQLATFCREREIALALVVYPSPQQIFARDLDSVQVRYWRQLAGEEGLAFVDLFPAFIDPDAENPRETYAWNFIRGDVHWNEAGHLLAATTVGRALDEFVRGSD